MYLNTGSRIINTDQIAQVSVDHKGGENTTYFIHMSGGDSIRLDKAKGEWLLGQLAVTDYSG